MAIFSTVASPKPGGISQTSSSRSSPVPATRSATASGVGGWRTRESPQSRMSHCSFILRMASHLSSPSKRSTGVVVSRSRRAWFLSTVRTSDDVVNGGFGLADALLYGEVPVDSRHYDELEVGHGERAGACDGVLLEPA